MEIRASDDDRQRTVAALERHAGAGRLTLDEFAERARAAHSARTLDDLAAVVHDLPAEPTAGAIAEDSGRGLYLLFAIAAMTLVLLGVFVALRS
ncbi:hypothetical protein Ade02nite_27140 [Paractinoplanes deccanensis]|uniref:DUF1707 domain-containing protein n=1 Tax=Paractinoplanes deccanensis TaxID=113561 RepID=A0ABQ3Y282_9ACTN|nr:DUF1707 domain-containing protein [Actinoplanes deccanensis]GID74073.1 hypothetical protein Ade02nite_27140 [Actinoplanes deccanensis]